MAPKYIMITKTARNSAPSITKSIALKAKLILKNIQTVLDFLKLWQGHYSKLLIKKKNKNNYSA